MVGFAVLAAFASTVTAPSAAASEAGGSEWTVTSVGDATTQAFSDCQATRMCVWPNVNGTGSTWCWWQNADTDWRTSPAVCSWSDTTRVRAIYNHGTSTTFSGVCLYRGANYNDPEVFVPRGVIVTNATGALLRSHRWVRPGVAC